MGPYFLMNVLFDACNWEGPAFMAVTDRLMQEADAVHATGVYLKNGVRTTTAPATMEDFSICQYHLRKTAYK